MKTKVLVPAVLALLCASAGAQQLYKSVAPDGTVSYSDKPPTSANAKIEKKNYGGGSAVTTDDLPFELANAARNNPVVIYTAPGCALCDQGRKALNDRGIPFSEKTVISNDEITQFLKQMGGPVLPVMTVGHTKLTNYFPDQWTTALNSAGYPANNIMPKSHKNPPAEPLIAQAPAPAAAPAPAPPTPTPAQQPADGKPAFHF